MWRHCAGSDVRPTFARPCWSRRFAAGTTPGEAASFAVGYLQATLEATTFATVPPEDFFDFQSHRPRIHIENGALEGPVEWPTIEILTTEACA